MFYYEVAIIGFNLPLLSYHSKQPLKPAMLVSASLGRKLVLAVVINAISKPKIKTKECSALGFSLSDVQFDLMQFIAKYYACNIGLAAALFSYKQAINAKTCSSVFTKSPKIPPAPLSFKQQTALNELLNHQASLLFGDTGSGKTEIYIHAISEALASGKEVLFLMPEISLTPQMCSRISKHFNYGLWHSKVNKSAKEQVLKALDSGQIRLVLGARSALFLPWKNLGLIIVDEEHDSSYKSSRYPCINAKDLALYVAFKNNAKVILGSATPSMSSFYNSNLFKFRLKGTHFQSSKEVEFCNNHILVSPKLVDEIIACASKQQSSLIFLPVRANFRQVICQNCSKVMMCPRCSVALSLHHNVYRCHYCNYKEPFSPRCKFCDSDVLAGHKMGTAGLANELDKALQERGCALKIARLDSDEASSPNKLKAILKEFENQEIDVLIGTQMISKGHDYHNIGFCAILGIDDLLFYPEYSAKEQTLALAIQVAGRAGRANHAKVMIDSKYPEFFQNYLNDYEGFLKDEALSRALYPPFKRLLRFIIQSKNEDEACSLCEQLSQHLLQSRKDVDDYELVGFGQCAIEKIDGFYRYFVLVRSDKKMLLSYLAANYKSLPKVTIDIDPVVFS